MQKAIEKVQQQLVQEGIDGWLIYDFRGMNRLAKQFLELPEGVLLTRRYFYWIPQQGDPVKLVHSIESSTLESLPGDTLLYGSWQKLEEQLQTLLNGSKRVAMEYSPRCAIPYLSMVDGGTLELVRGCGVEVVSSAPLLQVTQQLWGEKEVALHRRAVLTLEQAVAHAWAVIAEEVEAGKVVTEHAIQQQILQDFAQHGFMTEEPPIVAVNAHAADPHYIPNEYNTARIVAGDFVLIDLFCKEKSSEGVYGDITRVAVLAKEPTAKQQEVFTIVREARDAALALVEERFRDGEPLMGYEVDACCRSVIEEGGYGEYFIHRTGHNISKELHGPGTHLDNLETQDRRQIIPGSCFSVEPGIYIPGELGVRLETNVVIHSNGSVEVTGGLQDEILCLV